MYAEPGLPSPNSDRSLESLETRLRALPAPPVPGDLESRLLSGIPAQTPQWEQLIGSRQRRWVIWGGLAGALAAACLLITLLWPKSEGSRIKIVKDDGHPDSSEKSLRPESRRDSDTVSIGTFTWPLDESSPMLASTAIPPDLLD